MVARDNAWRAWLGFGVACGFYLALNLWDLRSFPPNFFCDEAAPANWAEHLLSNGFRGPKGQFLPTFCPTGNRFTVGTTLYLQLPLVAIWGKHWLMPRVLTVLLTFVGAAVISRVLGRRLGLGAWWSFPLWLMVNPAWFLHIRTGYDAPVAAVFFGLFLACGIAFLAGEQKAIYATLLVAALSFYSSASARLVVPLAVGGLFWLLQTSRQSVPWKKIILLGCLLTVPFLRYLLAFPGEQATQLRILGSFWSQEHGVSSRIAAALGSYISAWAPSFWLEPGAVPLRHSVEGLGLLHPLFVVFAVVGIGFTVWRALRGPAPAAYRFILVCLVAAPAAALVFEPGISRQFFVIPVLATLAVVGSSAVCHGTSSFVGRALGVSLAGVLLILALRVGVRALAVGPSLDTDYGFYGWQWGAPELFGVVQEFLKNHPAQAVMISATAFNDSEELGRFFLKDHSKVQWISFDWLTRYLRELPPNALLVFPWMEYQKVRTDVRFSKPELVTVLYDPGGKPAFAFCRLKYAREAASLFARELEERRKLVRGVAFIRGELVTVWHSLLDMGPLANAFDGNKNTLIRTMEANPLQLDLQFSNVHTFVRAHLRVGAGATNVRVACQLATGWQVVGEGFFPPAEDTRDVIVNLRPVSARVFRVEIEDSQRKGDVSNVHLWELRFEEFGGHE